jgi:hypothetical protein
MSLLSGMSAMAAALAVAFAMICALVAGIWRLVRKKDADTAVLTGACVFMGVIGVAFTIMTFLRPV